MWPIAACNTTHKIDCVVTGGLLQTEPPQSHYRGHFTHTTTSLLYSGAFPAHLIVSLKREAVPALLCPPTVSPPGLASSASGPVLPVDVPFNYPQFGCPQNNSISQVTTCPLTSIGTKM